MISWGANTDILSKTGETAISLEPNHNASGTSSCGKESQINAQLSNTTNQHQYSANTDKVGFTPNYLQHPELNHKVRLMDSTGRRVDIFILEFRV